MISQKNLIPIVSAVVLLIVATLLMYFGKPESSQEENEDAMSAKQVSGGDGDMNPWMGMLYGILILIALGGLTIAARWYEKRRLNN